MSEDDRTPHPEEPAEGKEFDDAQARGEAGAERAERDERDAQDAREKPLDEEARDWDIDITQSDGPVLEDGEDLDTGAGIHRHRP